MNLRRGLIRLLTVGAGVYWIVAGVNALNGYRSPADMPGASDFVFRASDHKFYSVTSPPGATCESGRAFFSAEIQKRYGVSLPADACAHAAKSKAALARRQGRREALGILGSALSAFAGLAAAVAAAWWIVGGFLSRPPKPT